MKRKSNMTLQDIHHLPYFHRLADAINRTRRNIADERKKRDTCNRTFRELSAMSSRELNDIGIDRADIAEVAAQSALLK
jgi:uncharacterized protein YjiS (DUF1127 family)